MELHPPRPAPARSLLVRLRAWITWFGVARLVAAGVSVVLVAGSAFWLLRSPHSPTEAQLPYAPGVATSQKTPTSTTPPEPSTTTTSPEVVVYVAGAVVTVGVFHLPAGARVVDAIAAAGGLRADAVAGSVNLAALVRDGSRIYVPAVGEAVPADPGAAGSADDSDDSVVATSPAGPLDLNQATAGELDGLPGVGPATAAAIVAYRDAHGPFGTVDDLADVRGIGPAKLEALRGLVTT